MLQLSGFIKLLSETIKQGDEKVKEIIFNHVKSFGVNPEEVIIDNIGLDGDDFVRNYKTVIYTLHFKN